MSSAARRSVLPGSLETPFEKLRAASEILAAESESLARLARHLPLSFADAVDLLLQCRGAVIVTGMGKAGWIGQKISASLASTGTRSHFLHPAEAMHGDLGRIGPDDVVLALSNSGETDELLQILPSLSKAAIPMIAITGQASSTLGRAAEVVIEYGRVEEACHLNLAPSTSTTLMLGLGDALALVVSQARRFQAIDFARFHPGGSLGRKLSSVRDLMRPIAQCRVARTDEIVRAIYVRSSVTERRVGVILVTDLQGQLAGIFTDSDLARLLEKHRDEMLDRPIAEVMTPRPVTVSADESVVKAVELLARKNIREIPVVDQQNQPVGLSDITDVIGLLPV
ncbi:MAG: SIS domain-containing protein [Planctomycetota bacterium]